MAKAKRSKKKSGKTLETSMAGLQLGSPAENAEQPAGAEVRMLQQISNMATSLTICTYAPQTQPDDVCSGNAVDEQGVGNAVTG